MKELLFKTVFWGLLGLAVGFALASFYIPNVAFSKVEELLSGAKMVAVIKDWLGYKVVLWVGNGS